MSQPAPPRSTSEILETAETVGTLIRHLVEVSAADPFDPLEKLDDLGVSLLWSDEVVGLDLGDVKAVSARTWSGASWPTPPGEVLPVLLNRNQTIERARVTLLEEVAHHLLGHRPSVVMPGVGRTYSGTQEKEAYWSGAAALLPAHAVSFAVWQGERADELARQYGVSDELVEMRIKLLGLWQSYTESAHAVAQSQDA